MWILVFNNWWTNQYFADVAILIENNAWIKALKRKMSRLNYNIEDEIPIFIFYCLKMCLI